MPFSSLQDPVDLARASGALEKAWAEVKGKITSDSAESERSRLAFIVASLAVVALDEDELAHRSVERFQRDG